MRYTNFKEDILAISSLLQAGRIDAFEAHEIREYVGSLA